MNHNNTAPVLVTMSQVNVWSVTPRLQSVDALSSWICRLVLCFLCRGQSVPGHSPPFKKPSLIIHLSANPSKERVYHEVSTLLTMSADVWLLEGSFRSLSVWKHKCWRAPAWRPSYGAGTVWWSVMLSYICIHYGRSVYTTTIYNDIRVL
jgi:hypothetical protein